jgi:hypothetical protein
MPNQNCKRSVNLPAYGNVEHEGTAIVSEISIKWALRKLFLSRKQAPSGQPMSLKSKPLWA